MVSELNSKRKQKRACLLQEGRGNPSGVSIHDGKRSVKSTVIMQEESQLSCIHTEREREVCYSVSPISSGAQYLIIIISLSGPMIRPGHENRSVVFSYSWCTLDMSTEIRQ